MTLPMPTLETPRVRLRPVGPQDLDFCLDFANDPELRGWLRFERPKLPEGERAWLEGLDPSRDRVWAMTEPATGRPVGLVSLTGWHHVARHAELGLGILDPRERGRGFGADAIRLLLRHAFEDMDLQRVHLTVHADNPARRLYARLGFREEGILRRHVYKRGAFRDLVHMGILREEWRA